MVVVNGKEVAYHGYSVAQMVEAMSLDQKSIVVEVNQEIVDQSAYEAHQLNVGDQVEVVRFVGGG